MKQVTSIFLTIFLFASTAVLASGSSGTGGIPSGASSVDPYKVTETLKCVITEIKPDGTVVVRDKKQETTHALAINKNTRFTAQSKKEFGGRKELKVADLKVGHELKVVKRQVNGEVLRVRVLKSS